jgi:hypothetical protein
MADKSIAEVFKLPEGTIVPEEYYRRNADRETYHLILQGIVENPDDPYEIAKLNYLRRDWAFCRDIKQLFGDIYECEIIKPDWDSIAGGIGDKVHFQRHQVGRSVFVMNRKFSGESIQLCRIHKHETLDEEMLHELEEDYYGDY